MLTNKQQHIGRNIFYFPVSAVLIFFATIFFIHSPVASASHWFSQSYIEDPTTVPDHEVSGIRLMAGPEAAAPSSVRVFDIQVSLHNNPQGDDNGNTQDKDSPSEQDKIESILQHFADAVYESTEGAHRIGKIRVFRNSSKHAEANIVWDPEGRANAQVNGFGNGGQIRIYDVFKFCDITRNMTDEYPVASGYTLAHEWAHYAYGLYDEYRAPTLDFFPDALKCMNDYNKSINLEKARLKHLPWSDDIPVKPSIMNSQWNATIYEGEKAIQNLLIDSRWLNFSIRNQGEKVPENFQCTWSNTAYCFQDTLSNAQHRVYGESAWETLTRKPDAKDKLVVEAGYAQWMRNPEYADLLASVAPPTAKWPVFSTVVFEEKIVQSFIYPGGARDSLDIIWMKPDITLVIVIDKSGSMFGTPIQNAKKAAQWLVDTVPEGTTSIGVIAFSSSPTTIVPITQVADAASRNLIKSQIDTIVASGGTAIGSAAQAALNTLLAQDSSNETRVVFLLSDGVSGDNALAPIPAYKNAQIPIFAFSYGDFADTSTLGQMAELTSGKLYISPTSIEAIAGAFQDANAAVTSTVFLGGGGGSWTVLPQEMTTSTFSTGIVVPIDVDSSLQSIRVVASFKGAAQDATFLLTAPSGADFNPTTVEEASGKTFLTFLINLPESGSWRLEGNGPLATSDFNYQATGIPEGATFALTTGLSEGTSVSYPEPMTVMASLQKNLPIRGAQVTALVTAPDGSSFTVDLLDDGVEADTTAEDGTYTATINYQQSGLYQFEIFARGTAGVAAETVNGLAMAPPPPGLPDVIPADKLIAEDFQRYSRFQATATGVVADDHGNIPQMATAIPADNSGLTPGKIEVSGDVDMFSFVVPEGMHEAVVRVSSLALGMDPLLTVFAQDGISILDTATIDRNQTVAGYIASRTLIEPSEILFVKVEHRQGGTGTYSVSVGSEIGLDEPEVKDSDGDGIQDDVDSCPNSILSDTVMIKECDTRIVNKLSPDGCTISDRISNCANISKTHGNFVSCVALLKNELKKDGFITGKESGKLESCAAQTNRK